MNRHPFEKDQEHHGDKQETAPLDTTQGFRPFSGSGRTVKGDVVGPSDNVPVEKTPEKLEKEQVAHSTHLFETGSSLDSHRSKSFAVKY